jgi:hypothetical protein
LLVTAGLMINDRVLFRKLADAVTGVVAANSGGQPGQFIPIDPEGPP